MNIFRRELKAGRKAFLFWGLGLFVLVFAGVIKSTGSTADGESLAVLVRSFPRIVLAVFGMLDVDIGTFSGFYAVLGQYVVLLTAVYAMHLGSSAVSMEAVDKTYEFVFTKPRTRSYILRQKLLSGLLYLALYCGLNVLISVLAASTLDLGESHAGLFAMYSLASLLVGTVFFALGAMLSASARATEAGARMGNYAVLIAFCIGVMCDMLEGSGALRLLSPFRYFSTTDLLALRLDARYIALCFGLGAVAMAVAFLRFEKRDLSAV